MEVRGVLKKGLRTIKLLLELLKHRLDRNELAPPRHSTRFEYQRRYVDFRADSTDLVLDIGSGGDPFPYATVLADRYLQPNIHRTERFRSDGKPIVICDIHSLPFATGSFGYVYCTHVLEHVDDPITACHELMRVGGCGYIETPTYAKDILFSSTEEMHKWHVVGIGRRLVFFEYDPHSRRGIESSAWRDIVHSKHDSPLRQAYFEHLDLFNVMFEWNRTFESVVFYLDGRVRSTRTAYGETGTLES